MSRRYRSVVGKGGEVEAREDVGSLRDVPRTTGVGTGRIITCNILLGKSGRPQSLRDLCVTSSRLGSLPGPSRVIPRDTTRLCDTVPPIDCTAPPPRLAPFSFHRPRPPPPSHPMSIVTIRVRPCLPSSARRSPRPPSRTSSSSTTPRASWILITFASHSNASRP